MLLSLIIAAVGVLPADRLAMADRLFNKGKYAEAVVEYRAISGGDIAPDELKFRIAECDRALGNAAAAQNGYKEVFAAHPDSRHAAKAKLQYALGCEKVEKERLLGELDSDGTEVATRAAALYYLGGERADTALLDRCLKLDPKGKYAQYAALKAANLMSENSDAAVRRKGVELLVGIAFGKGELAQDAMYLAAVQCYRDKRYGESSSLLRRYRKTYPKAENVGEARKLLAWSDYLQGKYTEAVATCDEAPGDDFAYLKAASAYALGQEENAIGLYKKYLEDYPSGKYRKETELAVSRIDFARAEKGDDAGSAIASARRGFGISGLAADELRLAWAYEKSGKFDEAAAEYAKVAEKFPGSSEAAEALYRKAMIEARRENWSGAEMALAEALSTGMLGGRKAEAQYWRGVSAMRLGHEQEGAGFLNEALKTGLGLDDKREARLMLADYDFRNGREHDAKKAYTELVREGACERMSAFRMRQVGKILDPKDALTCAKALIQCDSADWRQAGWALKGASEEELGSFESAIESYRKCLAEDAVTEECGKASLSLGKLEFRKGEHDKADETLKRAVRFNAHDAATRAEAYLVLAQNAGAKGDWKKACAYATVVTTLFENSVQSVEAAKMIAEHPEVKENGDE